MTRIRVQKNKQDLAQQVSTQTVHDTGVVEDGGNPLEAEFINVRMSRVEEKCNDCLSATNGYLRAMNNMLGLSDNLAAPLARKKFPKQCDVDSTADSTFGFVKYQAELAYNAICGLMERDAVLRDAREMLRQYVMALRKVKPAVDSSPGLVLAHRWTVCYWMLVNGRSGTEGRYQALVKWREALDEFGKLSGA